MATRVIGIDVSKDKLNISDSEGEIKKEVKNSTASIVKHIVKKMAEPGEAFVVCEATGGYERTLVKAMQAAAVAVVQSVPGIGPVTTATLICDHPELHGLQQRNLAHRKSGDRHMTDHHTCSMHRLTHRRFDYRSESCLPVGRQASPQSFRLFYRTPQS